VTSTPFVYPEDLVFECTQCGDCCRGGEVWLGPGEPERLSTLDWAGRATDLEGLAVVSRDGEHVTLARRDDRACVFLGAENQCRIHEHFGVDAKPLVCRLFPFGFLPVGGRVAVDVSFACRSISEAIGSPLRKRASEWTALASSVGGADATGHETEHRFSKKYNVAGTLLWELEHHLLELLSNQRLSMLLRVAAVGEFIRLATTSDPRTDAARQLRQVMSGGVLDLVQRRGDAVVEPMDKTQRAIFFHLLFVMLNPTPISLRRSSGKARVKEVKRRVQAADAYRFEKASPWLDNRELASTYQLIAAVDPGYLADEDGAELVSRYLTAKIIGQRFMREGDKELPFLEAVPRLLLMFPMIVWTSKALASEQGRGRVEAADARKSLRLLDRSLGAVSLSELPAKQRKAWQFILLETDLPTCASSEMLSVTRGD
jgi:Fe-S-cluster containining protein